MKDVFEKSFFATLGAWLYLHEKADDIIKDLVEKGKMAPEEGKTFLDEISRRADEEKEQIKEKLSTNLRSMFSETGLATQEDVDELKEQLEMMKRKLAEFEKEEKPSN